MRTYGDNYTAKDAEAYGVSFAGEVSLTKQADAESCDINYILKRYEQTGLLPEMAERNPQYGDFSDVGSYQEAMQIVAHANSQFALLSANVRERFANDPAKFLEFMERPDTAEEAAKLGLATLRPSKADSEAMSAVKTDAKEPAEAKK